MTRYETILKDIEYEPLARKGRSLLRLLENDKLIATINFKGEIQRQASGYKVFWDAGTLNVFKEVK